MAKRSVALLSISSGITIRAAFVCRPIETHINVYQKESFLFLHFILYDHHFFFPSVLGKNVNSNNNNKKKLLFSPATNYEYRTRARVNARTEKPFWSKITAPQTITHTAQSSRLLLLLFLSAPSSSLALCLLSVFIFLPFHSGSVARAGVVSHTRSISSRTHLELLGFLVCLVFDMK